MHEQPEAAWAWRSTTITRPTTRSRSLWGNFATNAPPSGPQRSSVGRMAARLARRPPALLRTAAALQRRQLLGRQRSTVANQNTVSATGEGRRLDLPVGEPQERSLDRLGHLDELPRQLRRTRPTSPPGPGRSFRSEAIRINQPGNTNAHPSYMTNAGHDRLRVVHRRHEQHGDDLRDACSGLYGNVAVRVQVSSVDGKRGIFIVSDRQQLGQSVELGTNGAAQATVQVLGRLASQILPQPPAARRSRATPVIRRRLDKSAAATFGLRAIRTFVAVSGYIHFNTRRTDYSCHNHGRSVVGSRSSGGSR